MKAIIIILAVLIGTLCSYAQGENNVWMFGRNYSLDFNQSPPLLKDNTYINGTPTAISGQGAMHPGQHNYGFAQAVCDAAGNIRFMVKMHLSTQNGQPSPNLFDRNEVPIAGTDFLETTDFQFARPIVVPHPGNSEQYFILYVRNGALLHSLFDITLNNGRGDIVPGYKNKLTYGYNTIVANRVTAIQGCDGVWLVAKHRSNNQYLSFKIDENGINTNPVISEVAQMIPEEYDATYVELVASPNGKMLATASFEIDNMGFSGGIEIYDFEKCSGKLKNPRLFDQGNYVYGVGFSPDNSKLYATYSEYSPLLTPTASWLLDQNLYQFDLTTPNIPNIVNSKTLILTNPTVRADDAFCPLYTPYLGSMKIGKDNRIYLTNGAPAICAGTAGVGLAMHIITNPNAQGLACGPSLNAIFNTVNGMSADNNDYKTHLPIDILTAPHKPDTIFNPTTEISLCFKNNAELKAPADATCVTWSDGTSDTVFRVNGSGKYWARYFKDCTVYIDSFTINMVPLPKIEEVQYGCSGYIMLAAGETGGVPFKMDLHNSSGGKIYGGNDKDQHIIYNLHENSYQLNIKIGNCDTMINVELKPYPKAEISIFPPLSTINFGEEVKLTAKGGFNYSWSPGSSLNVRTESDVIARPEENTTYSVIGVNDYGCRDTAYATVNIGYSKNIKLPNAFTPNNDGLNDIFLIPSGYWSTLQFDIYNRFGQLVYQKDDHTKGWDGTFKGKPCDAGVYYYSILLSMPDNTNYITYGEIHLIR